MKSPFPGMDPYLEQSGTWHDFHEEFCVFCRAQLVPQLPDDYIAKLEEHVYVHELPAGVQRLTGRSEVSIHERRAAIPESSTATIPPPVFGHVDLSVDLERESFIEIHDKNSHRVVTIIEFLNPSNKQPRKDRDQYLAKRSQNVNGEVHFVEIDLLRGGPRMPVIDLPDCDYCVMVSRA